MAWVSIGGMGVYRGTRLPVGVDECLYGQVGAYSGWMYL